MRKYVIHGVLTVLVVAIIGCTQPEPTATPTPTVKPIPTAIPTPTLEPTSTPTATPSPIPTLKPTPSLVPTPTPIPTSPPTPIPTPTRTPTPSPTPIPTPTPTPTPTPIPTPTPTPTPKPLTFEEIIDQAKKAIVRVVSTEGIGTGVIFDEEGLLLTNHHVVGDDLAPLIELHDGRKTIGLVVGVDEITDVALIRISAPDVRPAKLGDSSELMQGQDVVALGFPLTGEVTITRGIVSATERQLFTVGPQKGCDMYKQTPPSTLGTAAVR